jgi:hypothetical protein
MALAATTKIRANSVFSNWERTEGNVLIFFYDKAVT